MMKNLLTDSLVYGASRVLTMVVGMFLLPMYTKMLSRADYGVIETFNMFMNVALLVLPCGLPQSIYGFAYERGDDNHAARIYSTSYLFLSGVGLMFLVFCYLLRDEITWLLIRDEQYTPLLVASLLTTVFSLLNAYNLEILRSQRRKYQYLTLSVGTALLLAGGGIYFVVYSGMGVIGFFYASVIAQAACSFVGRLINRKWLRFPFSGPMLRELLKYGLPFVPAGVSLVLMKFVDRMIVQRLLGLEDLGLYAMGIKISSIYDLVGVAFGMAWFPIAMKRLQQGDASTFFRGMYLKILVLFGLMVGVFCSVAQYLLEILVDSKFWGCGSVIYLFVLSATVAIFNDVLGLGIYASRKTKYIFLPAALGGLTNLLACYLLARWIGITGAALSALMGSTVYLVSSYVISQKLYRIDYAVRKGLGVVACVLVWSGLIYYLEQFTHFSFWPVLVVKVGLLTLALIATFGSGLLRRETLWRV